MRLCTGFPVTVALNSVSLLVGGEGVGLMVRILNLRNLRFFSDSTCANKWGCAIVLALSTITSE